MLSDWPHDRQPDFDYFDNDGIRYGSDSSLISPLADLPTVPIEIEDDTHQDTLIDPPQCRNVKVRATPDNQTAAHKVGEASVCYQRPDLQRLPVRKKFSEKSGKARSGLVEVM